MQQQLSLNFLAAFMLLGLELLFLIEKSSMVFLVNFALWICIFLIEIIFEKWFVALSQNFKINEVRRLSGISTTVGQIGLIIGPLLMILLKQFSYSIPYFLCMLFLLAPGIVPFYLKLSSENTVNDDSHCKNTKSPSIIYTLAFSLIWPTIAIFNITAPILAKNQFNSINVAGFMEFVIGSAMAIVGIYHVATIRYMNQFKRIGLCFFMLASSTILIFLFPFSLRTILFSTFIIGITFGYLRIELRAFLAHKFSSEDAGKIIARANSWSGPLVLIYCVAYYFDSGLRGSEQISIIFPLSFIIASSIICLLLISDSKLTTEEVQ